MSYHGEELDFDFLGTYRDKSTDEDDSDDDDRSEMHIGLASPSFDSSRENHEQDGTSIGVDSFDPPQSPVAQDIEVEGHEDSEDEGVVEGEDVCDDDDEGGVEEQVIASLINQFDGCDVWAL